MFIYHVWIITKWPLVVSKYGAVASPCFSNHYLFKMKKKKVDSFFFLPACFGRRLRDCSEENWLWVNSLNCFHDFTQASLSYNTESQYVCVLLSISIKIRGPYHGRRDSSLRLPSLTELKYKLVKLAKFAWSQWSAKSLTSYKQRIHRSVSAAENVATGNVFHGQTENQRAFPLTF